MEKGHWYICEHEDCKSKIPIPDSYFPESDDPENSVSASDLECPECERKISFRRSEAGEPVSKSEILQYLKNNNIKEKKGFKGFWEGEGVEGSTPLPQ